MKVAEVKQLLERGLFLLDGAVGTELLRRGCPYDACLEAWAVEHPEVVRAIHGDYLAAGADVIYTATFGANRLRLTNYGLAGRVTAFNKTLANIARECSGPGCLVAGCIGPTGMVDFSSESEKEAWSTFREQAEALTEAGVDLLVIETMATLAEARIALGAVKAVSQLPVLVSMVVSEGGVTLDGCQLSEVACELMERGAGGMGLNCFPYSSRMQNIVHQLADLLHPKLPVLAKPNAGIPQQKNGVLSYHCSPEQFAGYGAALVAAGATLVGGCCGTTPGHIARLSQELEA